MGNRKLFPKYPAEWSNHPDVLNQRVGAIEEHLEQYPQLSSASEGLLIPLGVVALQILSALSLVSPEARDAALQRLLGH
jgi:hypothetical protein